MTIPTTEARHIARQRRTAWKEPFAAFTLVELLIVIALTGLLLALLFGPLIQGFRLTRRATALVQAQDASRFGLERLTRELRQATYVFDNSATPIVLPLENPANLTGVRSGRGFDYAAGATVLGAARPSVLFGKIDFTKADVVRNSGRGQITDPTTGLPLGGGDLRLPLAPGTRIVRYFIGLRRNINADGTAAFYENVYEFPRTDNDLNPFVMYRVEFDPNDPNFVAQNANKFSATINSGGLNDPNFFYNTNATTGVNPVTREAANGRSYAQNWKDAADAILSSNNLDLLTWRRDANREIVSGNPFQLGAQFSPAAVVGDTATPGFIGNQNSESPGAVPTLYSTQHGQWTIPFVINVYRASAQNNPVNPRDTWGTLQVFVTRNTATGQPRLLVTNSGGRLAVGTVYQMFSVNTGKIFFSAPGVSFIIDPVRGRIETGLPPIAGTAVRGAPYYYPYIPANNSFGPPAPMPSGDGYTLGELAITNFRQNTRRQDAGQGGVPDNQGIIFANLAGPGYYIETVPVPAIGAAGTQYLSPFAIFGTSDLAGTGPGPVQYTSAMLVAGSERVLGPDNDLSLNTNDPNNPPAVFSYQRVPASATAAVKRQSPNPSTTPNGRYIQTSPLRYLIENYDQVNEPIRPIARFDVDDAMQVNDAPGLPAKPLGVTGDERDVRISFLWQNNYARNQNGEPIDVNGRTTGDPISNNGPLQADVKPEPDVFKVDYSTRAQINITVGVRVYDTTTRNAQVAQVSGKVKVNNASR